MSINNSTEAAPRSTDTSDLFWEQFRDNLRELLDASGMTQKSLAKEAGIPYSTLNKKMRGVYRTWWAVDLAKFHRVFNGDPLLFRGLTEAVRQN
jgi:transcriptional regulator with XRE-family HTH domain